MLTELAMRSKAHWRYDSKFLAAVRDQAASAWIAEHFKPVSMEHRLYSREHDYAGTLDVVGEVDGKLAVVDWKTSKAIYGEMPLQAAGHRGFIAASCAARAIVAA